MRLNHWKYLRTILISLVSLAICSLSAEVRTWTSADGSQTFEGALVDYNDYTRQVTVDRGDRKLTFPETVLSKADIDYVKIKASELAPVDRYGLNSSSGSSRSSSARVSGSIPDKLPAPDGAEARMSEPVQVFIIMGQSNTLEFGQVTDALKTQYPYLADDSGNWTTRKDVRNVSVMVGKGVYRNDWLTISGNKIGIEIGIGHYLGHAIEAPVMILKSAIGNRSLGWDLLPPSVGTYEHNGQQQPGYREMFASKTDRSIVKWDGGGGWYAGKQYDDDVANAKNILEQLDTYYPGAKGYEVAGFLWWQGDKDMRNAAHYDNYEKHLVELIKSLRKDFNAPNAAFVTASLGQTKEDDTSSGHGIILQAMKKVASGKYSSELGDNIGFVYTNPLSMGSSSSAHYGGNAQTYMNVGEAMGKRMVEMLSKR